MVVCSSETVYMCGSMKPNTGESSMMPDSISSSISVILDTGVSTIMIPT